MTNFIETKQTPSLCPEVFKLNLFVYKINITSHFKVRSIADCKENNDCLEKQASINTWNGWFVKFNY